MGMERRRIEVSAPKKLQEEPEEGCHIVKRSETG